VASDWEQLASDFEPTPDVLIAEVDCAEDSNQGICAEHGIQGFPTLKYGNPSALDDYDGGREYDALKTFASENLKPTCSPVNLELCAGEEKTRIEALFKMSEADLQAQTDAVDALVQAAEEEFEKAVEALQEHYMKMMEENDKKKDDAKKNSNYKVIKAVLSFKKSQVKEEL
jgi:hypothetical protein